MVLRIYIFLFNKEKHKVMLINTHKKMQEIRSSQITGSESRLFLTIFSLVAARTCINKDGYNNIQIMTLVPSLSVASYENPIQTGQHVKTVLEFYNFLKTKTVSHQASASLLAASLHASVL